MSTSNQDNPEVINDKDGIPVVSSSSTAASMEQAYTYEEPPDDADAEQEQEQETQTQQVPALKNLPDISQYTEAVKHLAQQKAFQVVFLSGKKKIYQRRKSSMKEVIELERKRAAMKTSRGTPLQVAQALADFYWYSSQCHLIETRTGKPMSKADYEDVVFEDFRKIIDACEFVMLFGVPS